MCTKANQKWHHFTDILIQQNEKGERERETERESQIGNEKMIFLTQHIDNVCEWEYKSINGNEKEDMKMLSTRINFNGQFSISRG